MAPRGGTLRRLPARLGLAAGGRQRLLLLAPRLLEGRRRKEIPIPSAERDLAPAAGRRTGEGLLALGGPEHDAGTLIAGVEPPGGAPGPRFRGERPDCGDFATQRFERLPAAAREAAEVASIWRGTGAEALTLTGAEASEAAFKSRAPGRRRIHLATHGFFLGGRCAGENPLHLSGLALAGANHRDTAGPASEDGILTAEEIAALDLTGVEWVVLSGCDTGVGEVEAGEGVLGLRRAFEVAGVGALIMSLWAVDDESAREWMRALYEGRAAGLTTADAVREASRRCLRARRAGGGSTHPFHWGAFAAVGDWK